jgi:hypothetical protein
MGWRTIQAKNQVERQGSIKGVRILEQTVPLVTTTAAQLQTGYVQEFIVSNPSSRVTMCVEIFFEPETEAEDDIVSYNASNWSLRAVAVGQRRDRLYLHEIPDEQAADLPRSYEVVSGVKKLRGISETYVPTVIDTIAGTWYVRAYWEPVVDISDDELVKIFNDCTLTVTRL